MRIESTYTFPAAIAQVFGALLDPDAVRRALPDCERLIQLGPAEDDGTMTCEVRLRAGSDASLYTGTIKTERLRRPTHLGVRMRGQGPGGQFTARGSLDLVDRDGSTVMAYVWDVDSDGASGAEPHAGDEATAARLAQIACARLAAELRGHTNGLADAMPMLRADTARGKIILLPPDPPAPSLRARMRPLLRGGAWAAAGLAAGVLAIALAVSIIRRRDTARDTELRG